MKNYSSLELKIPPPVVFLISAALMWLLSTAVPWAVFVLPARKPVALSVAAAGGLLAGSSILSFLRAKTTVHPEKPLATTKLVVGGAYRISRNPMYLSLLLVLIGWAVYLENIAAAASIPLFVAYLNRFQIIPEERALSALFGSEFEAYRKRVRRWM